MRNVAGLRGSQSLQDVGDVDIPQGEDVIPSTNEMDLEDSAAFMLYARDCFGIDDMPIVEFDKARHKRCSSGLQYRITVHRRRAPQEGNIKTRTLHAVQDQ